MACNNRLLNLPLELFFKITNYLTIYDLINMEKSGLFELNDQGISDVIQAAFERPRHIHIDNDSEELETLTTLLLRCGAGLRSLIARRKHQSFLRYAHRYDKEFGLKLAASCPNIERFGKHDFDGDDTGHALRDYISNIEVSKLVEIDAARLTHDDLLLLFTPSLKSVRVNFIGKFIELMEELNVSRPNFGTHIERLTILPIRNFNADNFRKLRIFFPNVKTMIVKAMRSSRIKCVYNREKIYRPDFVYQLELIDKYNSDELIYSSKYHGEKFDFSSVVKYRPIQQPFDASVIDQLTNLQTLQFIGNDMMSNFSDYLSDTTFKSLKELKFTQLKLNAVNLAKFEKILLTGRFAIRNIINCWSFGVHSAMIPLLHKFCRNVNSVLIALEPVDTDAVMLSAVEIELLKDVGIAYELKSRKDTSFFLLRKG